MCYSTIGIWGLVLDLPTWISSESQSALWLVAKHLKSQKSNSNKRNETQALRVPLARVVDTVMTIE